MANGLPPTPTEALPPMTPALYMESRQPALKVVQPTVGRGSSQRCPVKRGVIHINGNTPRSLVGSVTADGPRGHLAARQDGGVLLERLEAQCTGR